MSKTIFKKASMPSGDDAAVAKRSNDIVVGARRGVGLSTRTTGAPVSIRDIHKRFGGVQATCGVSLNVPAGEFVTLLGPSGSGKTTTLMMVAGFLDPDSGEIEIDGQSVLDTPAHRRNLGIVFQSYALFPHLTVAENLAFPLQMRGYRKHATRGPIKEMLQLVRLSDKSDSYPAQISGGQQQRVALARALIFEPSLVLLDEPLGALDAQLRQHLQLEIKEIQRRLGLTVVAVTHDQGEALTMSDRIAVMNEGKVLQFDRPDVIYERPTTRFVASFLGESNFLGGVAAGGADGATMSGEIPGCGAFRFPAIASVSAGKPVLIAVRPEKMELHETASADPGTNEWPCTVVDRIYSGEMVRYRVRVGDQILSVKRTNNGSGPSPQPGDDVYVSWRYEAGAPVDEDRLALVTPR